MSTSEKQKIASRQNAQKSTGPKTEAGKKKSSQNAVKHGLHSCQIAINSPRLKEDANQYEILVASLVNEHKPRSPLQEHLVKLWAADVSSAPSLVHRHTPND